TESYENFQAFPYLNSIYLPNVLFVISDTESLVAKEAYKNPPNFILSKHPSSVNLVASSVFSNQEVDYGSVTRTGFYISVIFPDRVGLEKTTWLCIDGINLEKIGTLSVYNINTDDLNHNIGSYFPSHQVVGYFGYGIYRNEIREYNLNISFWRRFAKKRKRKKDRKRPEYNAPNYTLPNFSSSYSSIVTYDDNPQINDPADVFTVSQDAINPCD
ncbi:MAG: hypothetical protein ACK4NC_07475, partial [Candidatus Gracilibacteria bacterium]